jgi:hypothetical protein
MDFTYPEAAEAVRSEIKDWLAEHLPDGWQGTGRLSPDELATFVPEWRSKLSEGRWLGLVGEAALRDAVRKAETPFILKPNRGGKGLGVQLYQSAASAEAEIDKGLFDDAPDGAFLVQRYIASAEPTIIRNEFVGGERVYSVRVDTSGGFLLCPADACDVPETPQGFAFCPAGATPEGARPKFEILPGFSHPLHAKMKRFLAENAIEVAGIEMIVDTDGKAWVYDINTNTNYNPDAEAAAGLTGTDGSGMGALASFLGRELKQLTKLAAAD